MFARLKTMRKGGSGSLAARLTSLSDVATNDSLSLSHAFSFSLVSSPLHHLYPPHLPCFTTMTYFLYPIHPSIHPSPYSESQGAHFDASLCITALVLSHASCTDRQESYVTSTCHVFIPLHVHVYDSNGEKWLLPLTSKPSKTHITESDETLNKLVNS